MVRAKYVFLEEGGYLAAIYGEGVEPEQVAHVAERLARLPNIGASAEKRVLDWNQKAQEVTVVLVGSAEDANPHRALQLLKELTQPELPVAIMQFVMALVYCPCKHKSLAVEMAFLPAFEPEDEAAFREACTRGLAAHDLFTLWESEPGQNPQVDTVVADVLAGLGAYASEIIVVPLDDPLLCVKHH